MKYERRTVEYRRTTPFDHNPVFWVEFIRFNIENQTLEYLGSSTNKWCYSHSHFYQYFERRIPINQETINLYII